MVQEYSERLYERAARRYRELSAEHGAQAVKLSDWKNRMRRDWHQIKITDVQLEAADRRQIHVGDPLTVSARVQLGPFEPGEVSVQVYYGEDHENTIRQPAVLPLSVAAKPGNSDEGYLYRGTIPSKESGAYGFSVRVVPTHPSMTQDHELRLITWA